MRVGGLRRTTPSAALVLLSAGLVAACTGSPAPAARAADPAVHVKARSATSPPSLTLTTGYAAINEGTVNPVTVQVRLPVAITSGTIGLTGTNAPHCTPLALSGHRTVGTSTCWNTAGSGKGHAEGDRDGDRWRPSVSLSSPAVRITVTRRVPPDVPAATVRPDVHVREPHRRTCG